MDLTNIRASFAEYFKPWGITLPAEVPRTGRMSANGWHISWSLSELGFEFRCGHRMTNERYEIIREDGSFDISAHKYVIRDYYTHPADATPEQIELVKREFDEENRQVEAYLTSRGL